MPSRFQSRQFPSRYWSQVASIRTHRFRYLGWSRSTASRSKVRRSPFTAPMAGRKGGSLIARTNAAGEFEMTTMQPGDGVLPGNMSSRSPSKCPGCRT